MRKLQIVKVKVTQIKKKDGLLTTSDKEAAEELCSSFKEVFTVEEDNSMVEDEQQDCVEQQSSQLRDVAFSIDSVYKKLINLDSSKSPGPDGLHPHLLKSCANNPAKPLKMIYQKSVQTGKIPQDWKMADISPIFKKGLKTDPRNYRPVSLTSVPCKIMESLIKDELLTYLEKTKVVSAHQHGFVKGRSCLTNLLHSFEEWTRALDEGYGVDVVYLDFRKAFDSVPHRRLVKKLKKCGLSDTYLKWIFEFLTKRKMRVKVNGRDSNWVDVISGVPQGSVLGPLLFFLYVNDLPDWIVNSIRLFADDVKIWVKLDRDVSSWSLQNDLYGLCNWTDKWLLKFNVEKCKVMHVGHNLPTKY